MDLRQKIEQDFGAAFKAKQPLALLTLRQLKAALTNAEIAKRPAPLTEDDILKVIKTEVKRRREAIELYCQGDRKDLVEKETAEIAILSGYVPAELTDEQLDVEIQAGIAVVGAIGPQDMGKVMGQVTKAVAGKADGSRISQLVKTALAKLA